MDKFPKEKDATVIKVIAQQFQWNGWYPGPHGNFCANDEKFFSGDNPFGLDKNDPSYKENFIVAKDLVVPVNKPVIAYISSLDVIHCFACKPLRVTQDAIPGMVFPAHFTPVKLGTYQINCAQLCGIWPLRHERHDQSRLPSRLRQMGRRKIQGRRQRGGGYEWPPTTPAGMAGSALSERKIE